MMSCTLPLPLPLPLTALHADYPPVHIGIKVSEMRIDTCRVEQICGFN